VPELPEVETMVGDIRAGLTGRRILRARLSHDDVLRGVTRRTLLTGLKGARVRSVTRRAKHAVIETDRNRLVVQPGMTGNLEVRDRELPVAERRYAVLRLELGDGRTLIYHDVRRLGTLLWLDRAGWERYDQAIGPEPLERGFTARALRRILEGSRASVKKVLMDQRAVAGVGNIYAQEALFAARIDPSKPAREVPGSRIAPLRRELVRILRAAIRAKGSTVRDYRTGTGEPGKFQLELLVYGRAGEPCVRCGTILSGTHAIDARITVFCHRCQS
jgi:formamidopyrimidine-DNA glycosylase